MFKLGDDVYLGDELHKIYKISKDLNGVKEYYLIKYTAPFGERYEEWQISKNKINIGFNENTKN